MRKPILVVLCLWVFGMTAMAQTKFETKWHCSKATAEHKFDVGDEAGHTYELAQGNCNATASGKNFAEKGGVYTEFDDIKAASIKNHGTFVATMDNGDKIFYKYEGSAPADMKKPASNKWTIEGGTGKQKGIKGSGGCTGMRNADGSSDYSCSGSYSMAK